MRVRALLPLAMLTLSGLWAAAPALRAQAVAGQASGATPAADAVRMTVTVASKTKSAPPDVTRQDVVVRQESVRRPVLDWFPAQGKHAGLDLTVLVDDTLSAQVGARMDDLAEFIRALPPTTRVAVAYASPGISVLQDFTTDHELAAKVLRTPHGAGKISQSIFQAVGFLEEHLPQGNYRRAILLFSDGIDLFRAPTRGVSAVSNFDLERAIEQAQRNAITIYAFFASGASLLSRNAALIRNGQSSLSRLAEETGGEAFFSGSSTPLDFKPFLKELEDILNRQYVLIFQAKLGPKPGFKRIQVTTELSGARIVAPDHVYLPAATQ